MNQGAASASQDPSFLLRRAVYSFLLIAVAMSMIEKWSYLDSFFFTSFIAIGQGLPADLNPQTGLGKTVSSVLCFRPSRDRHHGALLPLRSVPRRSTEDGGGKIEEVEREVEGKGNREARQG